jgi:phosphoribosylaminoimidazolecarboxamide formyltransferase/IMP cyclohydrolase
MNKDIKTALVSVFYKEGLDEIILELHRLGVKMLSTGGTADFIDSLGVPVERVENITGYPSILGGRVKTLHPGVFGGILSRRTDDDQNQLDQYQIPSIDLVIVDLYPFEKTLQAGGTEQEIIEKIDIGGISLIRAAAKNFHHVLIVPETGAYADLLQQLKMQGATTDLAFRKAMAGRAFDVSSHYDAAIYNYFNSEKGGVPKYSLRKDQILRYGENPHQEAWFSGDLTALFEILHGKALSYNNLMDVDAAMRLMADFRAEDPTFAILKHNNACGLATRRSVEEAWDAALAGDPVSAFGGVLISNTSINAAAANKIDELFYEVLLAPGFDPEALAILTKKKNRILIQVKNWNLPGQLSRTMLNGFVTQNADDFVATDASLERCTAHEADPDTIADLIYASRCVKHLKSNAIALVKNKQLVGMGCGQTSRVDALRHAIHKAHTYQLEIEGAAMASEAFFPFPDCVEIGFDAGIKAVVQPGGSIKDKDSIDFCNQNGMSMYLTGHRHFKH